MLRTMMGVPTLGEELGAPGIGTTLPVAPLALQPATDPEGGSAHCRRPALIARCTSTADVVAAVRHAREHGLEVSVRGGGHGVGGLAVADGALMIDLSAMKGIHLDPAAQVVHAQAGVVLGEPDHATQAHGLAVPVGINSTTGMDVPRPSRTHG
ncbi:FAD-binding oxidoreductase [Streptomyces sp. ISL-11]|uniref:FAD-binding oxidoreductase n=1 Tax=Streptomyces sp. ISL-11 TaxID=2819174 RepID=UPI001BE958F9|nr:FAD-dependent oxidoreductase [Streptomyces sp. ISL-11]MBT2384658.1 FAD-dependent oxidoreductase [Streptomyces sp. ISL-11]